MSNDRKIDPDRQLMTDLMDKMKLTDRETCTYCRQEGIILTAEDDPDLQACWVCVKQKRVTNAKGFCPMDLGKYYKA